MHYLIALITALAGLIWALNYAGIDISSFNPFHWRRRRRWQQQLGTKAMHTLKRPLEAAALLIVAIVKTEGDISREQKRAILDIFTGEFKQTSSDAADLFGASVFMLNDTMDVRAEVPHILAPSREQFTREQAESLVRQLKKASSLEGEASEVQRGIIAEVERILLPPEPQGTWA